MVPAARKGLAWGVALAACIAAGAVVWRAVGSSPEAPVSGYTATPPTPLLDPAPDPAAGRSVTIKADRATATLVRDGNRWVVREVADYQDFDASRVEVLLEQLSSLTARYRATLDTAETPPVKPTSVTFETDGTTRPKRPYFGHRLTVPGKAGRLVTVWRDDEPHGWLTNLSTLPDANPTAWADSTLAELPRERVRRTRIEVDGSVRPNIERNNEALAVAVDGRTEAGLATNSAELSTVMVMLEKL